MLSVTLRQLEYAVAVARHGTVTAAAEALSVSQPALSAAIAQLEAHLGKRLFLGIVFSLGFWLLQPQVVRLAGVFRFDYGLTYTVPAVAVARLADLARLMQGDTAPAPPVRLAMFEDLAPVLLAPVLTRLAPPDITVDPQVLSFEAITEALRRGQIDMAVTYDLGLAPGTRRQDLARVRPHAVLAPDHPLAARGGVALSELAAEPLILADQGLSLGHVRALFAARGLAPRIAHRTATLELMRSFAANGMGVGLSWTRPAPGQSYDGRALVTRPLLDAGGGEAVVLATLPANPLSGAAQRLARALGAGVGAVLP